MLEEAHGILAELQSYNGAGQEIREVSTKQSIKGLKVDKLSSPRCSVEEKKTTLVCESHGLPGWKTDMSCSEPCSKYRQRQKCVKVFFSNKHFMQYVVFGGDVMVEG